MSMLPIWMLCCSVSMILGWQMSVHGAGGFIPGFQGGQEWTPSFAWQDNPHLGASGTYKYGGIAIFSWYGYILLAFPSKLGQYTGSPLWSLEEEQSVAVGQEATGFLQTGEGASSVTQIPDTLQPRPPSGIKCGCVTLWFGGCYLPPCPGSGSSDCICL